MKKTWQADDCEDMKEKDYSKRIPTNWAVPMFSKSRIGVTPPHKRKNGPGTWEYVPLDPPVGGALSDVKKGKDAPLPSKKQVQVDKKAAETKKVEPKISKKEEIKVPQNEAIKPKPSSISDKNRKTVLKAQ